MTCWTSRAWTAACYGRRSRSFPIVDLLEELRRQYAPLAQARDLRLTIVDCREVVRSDRVLLRRIIQNYLSNALRYTERGGVVVGCRRRGGELEIVVYDTGPGIAEHQRERMYAEFSRLEQGSPWGEKGLGLGLSICDRLARLMHHQLTFASRPGTRLGVRRAGDARHQGAATAAHATAALRPWTRRVCADCACCAWTTTGRSSTAWRRCSRQWGVHGAQGDEARLRRSGSPPRCRHRRGAGRLPSRDGVDGLELLRRLQAMQKHRLGRGADHRRSRRRCRRSGPHRRLPIAAQAAAAGGAARVARRIPVPILQNRGGGSAGIIRLKGAPGRERGLEREFTAACADGACVPGNPACRSAPLSIAECRNWSSRGSRSSAARKSEETLPP